MKGWIIRISIVVALFIAIVFAGLWGIHQLRISIISQVNPKQETVLEKVSSKLKISEKLSNYKFTHYFDLVGTKTLLAQELKTKQKFAIINPGWAFKITKDDIRANTINKKLRFIASRFNYETIKVEDFRIEKKGFFKGLQQNIPFVKFKIKLSGNINHKFEGIIGVIKNPQTKRYELITAFAELGKYNSKMTEDFYKNIQFNIKK